MGPSTSWTAVGRKKASRYVVRDMMQPAEYRPAGDPARRIGYGRWGPPARRALAQPPMRAPRIEVGDVLVQDARQVALVDDEPVIQTLRSRRPGPSFGERVRPRRPHGRPDPV